MYDKSLFVAYFLCLFGGIFGMHQFYLRRDYHGLIWLMTGGFFGIGIISDLWKLPKYVQDANEDFCYMEDLEMKMQEYAKPPFKLFRSVAQFLIANLLGYITISSVPQELIADYYIYLIKTCIVPFAVAVGVYLVGNIGREEGKFTDALIGAYLITPVNFVAETPTAILSIACCVYFNSYSKCWRRSETTKSLAKRISFITLCMIIYLALLSSMIYFNCNITIRDEKTVKCRDAVKNFFKSPFWKEFERVNREIWISLQEHGWQEIWQQLIDAMDLTGEANALKVLGLNETATQEEITIRCLNLSSTWYPITYKDPIAAEMFSEIQEAYEILSDIYEQKEMKTFLFNYDTCDMICQLHNSFPYLLLSFLEKYL